jgi:hypothetical protein
MHLKNTIQYRDAFAALTRLKEQFGITEDIRSIARYLLFSCECEAKESVFAWVGTDAEIDRVVVEAYEQAWKSFISGTDEDD